MLTVKYANFFESLNSRKIVVFLLIFFSRSVHMTKGVFLTSWVFFHLVDSSIISSLFIHTQLSQPAKTVACTVLSKWQLDIIRNVVYFMIYDLINNENVHNFFKYIYRRISQWNNFLQLKQFMAALLFIFCSRLF